MNCNEWHSCQINELAIVKGGKRLEKGEKFSDKPTPFPYIRVSDFKNFSVDISNLKYLTPEIQSSISRYIINKEDIYISIAGTIGLVGTIPACLDGANLTENAARIVLNCSEEIDREFLMYYLGSPRVQRSITARKSKNAQPKLALAQIKDLEILHPPLSEQKKIAYVLSTVQRAIAQQEQLIQTTTELKKALMHKLFTEGLHGEKQKETAIGLIPESWELQQFDQFATLQRGRDLPKKTFCEGTVPVIGATTVIGYHNESFVSAPGVTVVRSGSSAGKALYIDEDFWAHNVVLYVKDFHGNIPKFVYYKIQNLDLTKYRAGVAVPTLNRNTFSMMKIAVPDKEEQAEIVRCLDCLEEKIKLHQRKQFALNSLFQTLLHQLMIAQIRVHDIDLPGFTDPAIPTDSPLPSHSEQAL